MAVIYLQHPNHGSKVACGEGEAQYDESNGWTRYFVPDPLPEALRSPEPLEPESEEPLKEPLPAFLLPTEPEEEPEDESSEPEPKKRGKSKE